VNKAVEQDRLYLTIAISETGDGSGKSFDDGEGKQISRNAGKIESVFLRTSADLFTNAGW
jgi:hypothetical protein